MALNGKKVLLYLISLYWPKECNSVNDNTIGMVPMLVPMVSNEQNKVMLQPILIILI